ncbi:MAG: outer membrane beta-barrel protein [Pseudomonadota bacterium]
MKLIHKISFLAIACCTMQSPVLAQSSTANDNWYFGAAVGQSGIKLQSQNIVATGQQTTSDTGYKILGGYRFNQNWAAEFQYFDLGKYTYTFTGAPAGMGAIRNSAATVKTSGYSLSAVGNYPVSQEISLIVKLGVAQQSFSLQATDLNGNSGSSRASTTSALIGVGAEYSISKNVRIRAEYEYFGVPTVLNRGNQSAQLRTDLLSVGLIYSF